MEGNFPLEASSWPMKPNQSFLVSSEDLQPFLLQSRRNESRRAPPSGRDHKDGRLFPTPPPPPLPQLSRGTLSIRKLDPYLLPSTRINAKWTRNLNVKDETTQVLEENTVDLFIPWVWEKSFSDSDPMQSKGSYGYLLLQLREKM